MSILGHNSVPATLGRRIAECREHHGWRQKQLAEASGLSVTFLSELENDRRVPGAEALLKLADALETSLDYLVKGVVDPTPPRRDLVVPPELEAIAEEFKLSLSDTSQLVRYSEMVVARRNGVAGADEAARRLTREQWRQLHEWMNKSPI